MQENNEILVTILRDVFYRIMYDPLKKTKNRTTMSFNQDNKIINYKITWLQNYIQEYIYKIYLS